MSKTHTIHRSEHEAVAAAVVEVADASGLRPKTQTSPLMPTQIRRLTQGPRGAEWVRFLADYQDSPSVGYATLADLESAHEFPSDVCLDWVAAYV